MYIRKKEGLGEGQTMAGCDKIESVTLRVPFRIDFNDFLKLVCCAVGRWMPFRTEDRPGRQACVSSRNTKPCYGRSIPKCLLRKPHAWNF